MNEPWQIWLTACLALPGALGAGLRPPGGAEICQSAEAQLPPEQIASLLEFLAASHARIAEGLPAARAATWCFEQARLRCVARGDGGLLVLAVRPGTEADGRLDQWTDEFLARP